MQADISDAAVGNDGTDLRIQAAHIALLNHIIMESAHILFAAVSAGGSQKLLQRRVYREAPGALLAVILLREKVLPEVRGKVCNHIRIFGNIPGSRVALVGAAHGAIHRQNFQVDAHLAKHHLHDLIRALERLSGHSHPGTGNSRWC